MRYLLAFLLLAGCTPPSDTSIDRRPVEVTFERISDHLQRTEVPGGWLVVLNGYRKAGLTFVPDPEHKWEL